MATHKGKKKPKPIPKIEAQTMEELNALLVPVAKCDADLLRAMKTGLTPTGKEDIRFLVETYYDVQKARKGVGERARSAGENPGVFTLFTYRQLVMVEENIKKTFASYVPNDLVAVWANGRTGVGPVISSALSAMIDINLAPTAGCIWRFAGLDPTVTWHGRKGIDGLFKRLGTTARNYKEPEMIAAVAINVGHRPDITMAAAVDAKSFDAFRSWCARRPWNAQLKTVCWQLGESFVKVQEKTGRSFYKLIYKERRALEETRNAQGVFASVAKDELEGPKKYSRSSEAYKAYKKGELPKGRIYARAKRYAVKLFLAHWHHMAYELILKKDPPKPYVIDKLGHNDVVYPKDVDRFERGEIDWFQARKIDVKGLKRKKGGAR